MEKNDKKDIKVICPICKKEIITSPKIEPHVECGNSLISNNKTAYELAESETKFDLINFIFGVISIIAAVIILIFSRNYEDKHTVLGALYIGMPIFGLIQHLIFYNSDGHKSISDLHYAFISRSLKFYDFGSKFFVYSILAIQIFGLSLILYGLIK